MMRIRGRGPKNGHPHFRPKHTRAANHGGPMAHAGLAHQRRGVRRWLLGIPAVVVILIGAAAAWRAMPGTPLLLREDRDVLLVTIDTLRADALGVYGGRAATPNIDKLAARGIRFDDAHAHSVVTLPSHASILTGLYPFAHGIRDNAGYRLRPGITTIGGRLRTLGYATAAFVGAFPLDARFGLNAGFDLYDDRYASAGPTSELSMPERAAPTVVAAATRWIGGQQGRWFAWIHLYDPHAPYLPPPPFDREYASDPYAGEVAGVDHALGPLLDAIRHRKRPVLVVLTADHGEALGSHGEATHGLFAYEDTLRVPLILAATDADADGRRATVPARHIDIVPTILDSVGRAADAGLPGRSLLQSAEGGRDERLPSYFEAMTASINRGWAPLTGVLVGHHKFIRLPIPELYELSSDPHETRNLLLHEAARAAPFERLLSQLADDRGASGGVSAPGPESEETRRRLASLGYVSGGHTAPGEKRWTDADDPKRLIALDQAIQHAVELFERGAADAARATLEEVIRQRPDMATPYLHLAFISWSAGDRGRAIDDLRRAVQAGAATPEVQSQLGIYLAEGGRPDEAVAVLRQATAKDPSDVDAWNGLAIALAGTGRGEEAASVLRQVIADHPTEASALENLGTLLLGEGNLGAAREAFSRALALRDDRPVALNGLGVIDLREGHREAAVASWRRAVALDPGQFDALYNLGVALMNAGDRAAARTYLQQFAAAAPPAFYEEDLKKVRAWLAAQR